MRRPSSIEPFTPSPTVTLHPTLQAVLDNLDVQIEEELTRYRRQRRNPNIASQKKSSPLSQSLNSNSSDPTAIGILKSNIQLPSPRSSLYDSQPQPSQPQSGRSPQSYSYQAHGSQRDGFQREPQSGQLRTPAAPAVVAPATVQQLSSPTALQSPPGSAVNPALAETMEPAEITSYAEQNDLSAYTPSVTLQRLMQQPTQPPEAPEDYLESSEELLRSILEEDPELRAEREPNSMLDTLLTPLGIGSMLLLLLSSTTLGYVIMNPSSLGLWTPNSQSQSSSNSPAATQPSATQTSEAPSPDLSSEEFVDLDLDTLSTLPKKAGQTATKTPAAKPSPARSTTKTNSTSRSAASSVAPVEMPPAPQPQPNLSTVVIPAAPPVVSAPEPARSIEPAAPPQAAAPVSPEPINEAPLPTVTPQNEPAPAPTVATASESTPRNYYYVVTEYSGDSSLQEARGAVPDAYVRNLPNEGAKVQLGAFSEEAKAQELLQELQQQGIEAEVYTP